MTVSAIRSYHQRTKHSFQAYARGPGRLDWDNQPDPFRRYAGARLVPLALVEDAPSPPYALAWQEGRIALAALDAGSLARFFYDSLAISAWKRAGGEAWALRVNPSSGNLHPTEAYLLSGPVPGLLDTACVAHYAPRQHALELRAGVPPELWARLVGDRPPGTFFIGLSSIHWREAWKYGERAYRYCQHDLGHAIAALSLSAAGQGWRLVLLDELSTDYVAALLGLVGQDQPDAEHPDCLLAVEPQGPTFSGWGLPSDAIGALAQGEFQRLDWRGEPNSLSPSYVDWPAIQTVAEAAWKGRRKPSSVEISYPGCDGQSWTQIAELSQTSEMQPAGVAPGDGATLRQIVRRRRSAVRMDGSTTISLPAFYRLLQRTLPLPGAFPFNALPWEPQVHLAIFVHLVDGLQPGLYLLVRHPREEERLRGALSAEFAWEKPVDCPPELSFSLLAAGDARGLAQQLSCQQSIAGMGCFSLGLLAAFEAPLRQYGPWFYPRLFWECGMIGQVLYLEAEAAGLRGTGIGCFFDDAVHQVLGLSGWEYQSLYHFAVGGSVDDPRLATLPAYP